MLRSWFSRSHSGLHELGALAVLYGLYEVVRGLPSENVEAAMRHTSEIVALEQGVGIYVERGVQEAFETLPGAEVHHAGAEAPGVGLELLCHGFQPFGCADWRAGHDPCGVVRGVPRHGVSRHGVPVPHTGIEDLVRSCIPSVAQHQCARELAVFLAPNVNSYKRYTAGSWAPTTLAWGNDNRTCGFRVVGHGRSRRVETRIPGGDVNPYLALAALVAAGLHGIEHGLEPPAAVEGNAYESDAERFPSALRDAISALEGSTMARAAFGDQVVDHYLNYARTEQGLFDRFVTDWERKRYFERI